MSAKVLILEDNVQTAEMIRSMILEIDCHAQVETAETAEQAYIISIERAIDVFVLDIILITEHPGDTSGIKFAQNIREIPKYYFTPMIFITALADPELYAYRELHCFGYIEKPFGKKQVEGLLKKALQYTTSVEENKKVFLRKDGVLYAVSLNEIIYIQVRYRKMFVHTRDGSIEIPYKTIKAFREENESANLLQCNRYTLVNCEFIENIDMVNRYIKIQGTDQLVDIGVAYKNNFLEWINGH